jgi:hypothetical protein
VRSFVLFGAAVLLCAALAGCTPPPGVPSGASGELNYEGIMRWTWRHKLPHGCAEWTATESGAEVQLLAGSRCEGGTEAIAPGGRGVSYFTGSDFLIFLGYWPWTDDEYSHLIEYDNKGMISRILPCPHSLSQEQLNELRALAHDALDAATTDAERRTMARVTERLAATNGTALASGQGGCTDLPSDWYRGSYPEQDAWTRRR